MGNREKLLHRLAQREKMQMGKTAATFRKLSQSHADSHDQTQRLQDMISEKTSNIQTAVNKYQLQTNHWITTELTDQLEITQNKIELLARELGHVKKTMVAQEHKLTMIKEKKTDAKRETENLRTQKQDADQNSRRRR